MRMLFSFTALALFAGTTCAQDRLATATNYAVLAQEGRAAAFDGVPAGTDVGRGLMLTANPSMTRTGSLATTHVHPLRTASGARGVGVRETGRAVNADPNLAARAATSNDTPRVTPPTAGPHTVRFQTAIANGAAGHILIVWSANASTGAAIRALVDVDGDGTPEWRGGNNQGQAERAVLRVPAGMRGLTIDVTTEGAARVAGAGREGYEGGLQVLFEEDASGPSCAFTAFGTPCGAQLDGTISANPMGGARAELLVSQATPGALGLVVFGDQMRPVALPFSRCDLLIDVSMGGALTAFVVDRNGEASMGAPLPRMAGGVDISFQAITLGFLNNQPQIAATNGTNLVCR
ncbi:MAG: hypothetical protein H6834_12540 [Planctomycetes bacterium]|nr:hypothetical protein [Planctomycetota bacterium]